MKWLFISVGIALFTALVLWVGPENLAASLATVDVRVFLLAPLLSLVILLLLTVRFQMVLRNVVKGEFGFWNLFRIFCISNLFALTSPAKSGEFVKSYFLKRQGMDYGRGIIVVVLERIIDMVGIILLLLFFAIISTSSLASNYVTYSAGFLLLLLAGVLFFRSPFFIRLLRRLPVISKRLEEADAGAYRDILRRNLSLRGMARPMLVTAVSIVMIAARMYVIYLSLGLQPDFAKVMLVYLAVVVVGILSMIPGGLGSIEVTGTWLYSAVLGYDLVTVATALVLLRFSTYAVDIPTGIICSYFHRDKYNLPRTWRND